jgi:hypothetical protein
VKVCADEVAGETAGEEFNRKREGRWRRGRSEAHVGGGWAAAVSVECVSCYTLRMQCYLLQGSGSCEHPSSQPMSIRSFCGETTCMRGGADAHHRPCGWQRWRSMHPACSSTSSRATLSRSVISPAAAQALELLLTDGLAAAVSCVQDGDDQLLVSRLGVGSVTCAGMHQCPAHDTMCCSCSVNVSRPCGHA